MSNILVNKPQFNVNGVSVGTAVRVTSDLFDHRLTCQDALIMEVQPLSMKVFYIQESSKSCFNNKCLEFTPEDVEKGRVKIEFLVPSSLIPGKQSPKFD